MPCAVCAMSLSGFRPRRSILRPNTTSASSARPNVTTWIGDQLPDRVLDVLHGRGADQDHPGLHLAGAQPVRPAPLRCSVRRSSVSAAVCARAREVKSSTSFGQVGGVLGPAELGRAVRHVVHRVEPAVVLLARQRAVVRDALGLGDLGELQLVVELGRQVVPHVRRQRRADDGEHDQRQRAEAQRQPGAQPQPAVGPPQPGGSLRGLPEHVPEAPHGVDQRRPPSSVRPACGAAG